MESLMITYERISENLNEQWNDLNN